jgi:metallo-beta-lactamase class B
MPAHRQILPASLARLAALVALTCSIACTTALAQSQRENWNKPTPPFHIIDNLYYVGTNGLASYLIVTPEGNVLLDAALEESVPQIEKNIQTLGFKLTDVKFLLNSHAHLDHSGGLAQLKKDTGAVLISSQGDKSALEGGFYLGWEQNHAMDAPPVKVDRTVVDGQVLEVGGTRLTANLTPGHTRGCTSWSMPVKDAGKTLQVLFFCSSSVAANRLVGPPQYDGIVADYESTFRKAKTLKADIFLAPHPEFFNMQEKRERLGHGGANPFIDPTAFPAFIERSEADFHRQLEAQQAKLKGVAQ